jgi:sulfur carrier protein ThiS
MLVTARLRPPDRTVEVADVRRVADLLARLEVLPGAVLVIRDGALLTSQDELRDGDRVEVRFAISGGAGGSGGLRQPQAPEGSGEPRRGAPVDQAPGALAPRWIGGG